MSTYGRQQNANQLAYLKTSQALGITIQFSHRGGAYVTLAARINEEDAGDNEDGGHHDEMRTTMFEVSTLQTGFTAPTGETEPVTSGDSIIYETRTYTVDRWKANRYRGTYQLFCDDPVRIRSGVK